MILVDRQFLVISSDMYFNVVISNKIEQRYIIVVLLNKYFLNNNNGILDFVVGLFMENIVYWYVIFNYVFYLLN